MNIFNCIIIVLCVLISAGCDVERSSHSKALSAIDSVADVSPRRALAMLDSIVPKINAADKADRNYYDLLRIKTEDKLYVAHTTDTLMLRLLDYYENEGDKRLLPMAYYYAGRVYNDMNDDTRALPYFQKTIELADTASPLRYKAYSQMGYIFLYQGLYYKGLKAFRHSYLYNKKIENKKSQAYSLCGMAYCYQRVKNESQAAECFEQALNLSKEANDSLLETDILAQIAKHYYKQSEYGKALMYANRALSRVNRINARAVLVIVAKIYDKVGRTDEAVNLYEKVYDLDNVYAKYGASKWLGHYYLRKKDLIKAAYFFDKYETYSDSVQNIIKTKDVARIDAVYNYTEKEKENIRLKYELAENRYIVYIFVFMCISLIFAFFAFISHLKKKRMSERIKYENETKYLKEKYEQSSAFVDENKRKIESLNVRLARVVDCNESLAAELKASREQLENQNRIANMQTANRELSQSKLTNSDIFRKIRAVLNDNTCERCDKKIPKDYWLMLDAEVNRHYAGFKDRLTELCKISEYEYRLCLLLKIGVRPADISILTNKERNSVSSARKRLYKKAFGKDAEPKMWDEFIQSL